MDKIIDLGFAKLDVERAARRGYQEAVYCECKTEEQVLKIFTAFFEIGANVLGTRANVKQAEAVIKKFGKIVKFDETAKTLTLIQKGVEKIGEIAVCTAGTGDIKIAEEAAKTAEFYGSRVEKYYDVGVAGLHRLLGQMDKIGKANVIVAVAGMEGALGSVIAGLSEVPVIAVPTSIGSGASFNGISALLTMINSCAEGMTVVNIDNGFGAGYSANQINRLIARGRK